MEKYDMNALYLFNDGWQYKVGKIQKVNDKSVRMDGGTKINKDIFEYAHKLTDKEIEVFHSEIIKKLSNSANKMKSLVDLINGLKNALKCNELTSVNTVKLQENLDSLNDLLTDELSPFVIGDKKLNFSDYSERLTEVKEGES